MMEARVNYTDSLDKGKMALSSAHPIVHPATKCLLNVDTQQDFMGFSHTVILYKMCPGGEANVREVVNQYSNNYQPYFHSFGWLVGWLVGFW